MADKWAAAAKLASEKRLGEAQARRVLSEIYESLNDEPLRSSSVRDFLTKWSASRKADTAPRTFEAYSQVARDFLASLGPKADNDISQVGKADCAKYRDEVLRRTSIPTANKALKYLRVALNAAYKDGVAQENPAAKVDVIRRGRDEKFGRRPFTLSEITKILECAVGEWKGIILFGLYTGQRLKDVASLSWRNVDLERSQFELITGKTGRLVRLPLVEPLMGYLKQLKPVTDVNTPLFPEAFKIAKREKSDSRLSQQFYGLLVAADLAKERSKALTGNGRTLRRTVNEISFHSLRHTTTSLLKNAGVPEAVVMDIIGHDSKAISRHYTHVDDQSKKDALQKLPTFF